MKNEFKFYFVIQYIHILHGTVKYKGRELCAVQIDNPNKKLTSLMSKNIKKNLHLCEHILRQTEIFK